TPAEQRLNAVCEEAGRRLPKASLHDLYTEAARVWQRHITLDPEAEAVLGAFQSRGKSLALITNFGHAPHVRGVLSAVGLAGYFECLVISGEVGVKKPDPKIFSFALEHTRLKPQEVVFVGDASED